MRKKLIAGTAKCGDAIYLVFSAFPITYTYNNNIAKANSTM